MYKIINNRIEGIRFVQSPNISKGIQRPELLVLHYTAGPSMTGAVNHFSKPASKVSAHIVLDRDGQMTQMSAFTTKTWHAGKSSWKGRDSVNNFSIGIEIVNWGKLVEKKNGLYESWSGALVPVDEIYVHSDGTAWHTYPHKQLDVLWDLAMTLVTTYNLKEVVDHSMVSPGRKQDVGPAFDLKALKKHLGLV